MQRMCFILGVDPAQLPKYRKIHEDGEPWQEILDAITASNITNYSIFLREPENLLIAYWEYVGADYAADMEKIKHAPRMREWWDICEPMQRPLDSRRAGEWWVPAEQVFHHY